MVVDAAVAASDAHAQDEFVNFRGTISGLLVYIYRTAGTPENVGLPWSRDRRKSTGWAAWTRTANGATEDTATAMMVDITETLKGLLTTSQRVEFSALRLA